MKPVILTALAVLIVVGIGVGGFLLGQSLYKSADTYHFSLSFPKFKKRETLYLTASPHVGPLEETWTADIVYEENSTFVRVPAAKAKNVFPGNSILLESVTGDILPEPAMVVDILDDESDKTLTKIILFISPAVLVMHPPKAKIITATQVTAKRLPVSALQHEDDGSTFVWLIVPHTDQPGRGTIIKKPITPVIRTDDYFDVGKNLRTSDMVVEKPDPSLTEGKNINFMPGMFKAPLRTLLDEARTKAFEEKRIKDQELTQQKINMMCPAPATLSPEPEAPPPGAEKQ